MKTHLLACHPTTNKTIVKALGTRLFDRTGKSYVDFEAGSWAVPLGHSHRRITEKLRKEAGELVHLHYSLANLHSERLAEILLNLLKMNNGKGIFLSSGSEAVLLAIRLATFGCKGKNDILTFSTSYLSAYNIRRQEGWIYLDYSSCLNCRNECCDNCPLVNEINFQKIGLFIFEPVSGSSVTSPPQKLVTYIANEMNKRGGVIIVNEVTTGLGRTGKWFGYEHFGITPSIVVLGKGLGNGYPISGVLISDTVSRAIEAANFVYVQSHQNDPLGCAVATEVITILKDEMLIERAEKVGLFFQGELEKLEGIKSIRRRGLMIAVELIGVTKCEHIASNLLDKGYFVGTTPSLNLLRFYPPLTISEQEILGLCHSLNETLRSVSDDQVTRK